MPKPKKTTSSLEIVKGKEELSKEQKQFNRLTKQIENKRAQIENNRKKYEGILKAYAANLPSLETELARGRLKLAHQLDAVLVKFKFTDHQYYDLEFAITKLIQMAFNVVEGSKEDIALHDKYFDETFEEVEQFQEDFLRNMMEMELKNQGIDIDMSKFDFSSEEDAAKMQREVLEKMEEMKNKEPESKEPEPKKTKKQLQREALEEQMKKEKLKSVRGIYVSLAKLLHPDTASSPEEAKEKEELMKEVTEAYEKKDLPKLLELEMKWVNTASDKLSDIPGKKLKLYIETLKEQLHELNHEVMIMRTNPRYQDIKGYMSMTLKNAIKEIKEDEKTSKNGIASCDEIVDTLQQRGAKKFALEFAKEIVSVHRDPFDDMFIDY